MPNDERRWRLAKGYCAAGVLAAATLLVIGVTRGDAWRTGVGAVLLTLILGIFVYEKRRAEHASGERKRAA